MERPLYAWDPDRYREEMASGVPEYGRLQDEVVAASSSPPAGRILDLGIGSGLTAVRVADAHPDATLVGVDANQAMLGAAASALDPARTTLVLQRLEESQPAGPFDLVVSMLAVHHLDAAGKADLFVRVRKVLAPGGRLVLGDLVVPEDPADAVTAIDGVVDVPDSLADQLRWCDEAGLAATVHWASRDLAVIAASRR